MRHWLEPRPSPPSFLSPDLIRGSVTGIQQRRVAGAKDSLSAPAIGSLAVQTHGVTLIENLVGCAFNRMACSYLEDVGGLTAEERGILERAESVRGQAQMVADSAISLLLTNPDLIRPYMDAMISQGELRAARRVLMDSFRSDGHGE